jgi:DNA polymerase-3 subunit epsilon/CBS domain-containing protein
MIVSAARALALRFHVAERSTPGRLRAVRALHVGAERELDALVDAHGILLGAILAQQLVDLGAGTPPSNRIEVRRLERSELTKLKEALHSLKHRDEMVRDLLTAR